MATKVGKRRAPAMKTPDGVPPALLADPSAPAPIATDLATLVAQVPVTPTAAIEAPVQVAVDAAEQPLAIADEAADAAPDIATTVEDAVADANVVAVQATDTLIETAEAVTTPAVDSTADTVQKEIDTMATAFEAPKYDAPKLFTDMNDRAKAAMEKSGKLVQEMGEFGKGNVEAMVESSRIAAKGFEAIGHDAADYGRRSFEGLTATMKTMASVKSPADFFKLQSDYVRSAFDAAVAEASKTTEAMIKLAGDAAQPISSRVALAVDKVKTAA